MAWLGFVTFITIYWCFYMAGVTGRLGWALLAGWCVPILAMTLSFREGMQVNGLMVLICILLFFFCRRGLSGIRMWNTKQRKKHTVFFGILYVFLFLLMFYSLVQAQVQGYLLNVQGWGSERFSFWRLLLTVVPLLGLNYFYTEMVYTAIERTFLKKQELVLLTCRFYIANETGAEKGLRQGYFMEGVNNGVTYYFRMTRRTYYMLRKETKLRLQTGKGLFGGIYVLELDRPELLKKVRRRDRKDAGIGAFLFFLALAAGIWLFWFM